MNACMHESMAEPESMQQDRHLQLDLLDSEAQARG